MPVGEGTAGSSVGVKAKAKLFHGWYIVGVCYLAYFAYSFSLSSTLGIFFNPMSDEFGWPRSYLSSVRSFETLFTGALVVVLGPILDRRGTRLVMIVGGVVSGLGLILLGQVNDLLQFFLVRGIMVSVGVTAISNIVTSVAISNWFVRKRGRAMGIANSGLALGKIILAPVITMLIVSAGWREAWTILGFAILVLVPIPAALFLRRRPEDMGLRPDGVSGLPTSESTMSQAVLSSGKTQPSEMVWTRREAMRTSALWLVILTFGVAGVGTQGMTLHIMPFLIDAGFAPVMAAGAMSLLAVFQLTGSLGFGFVIDRFPIRLSIIVVFMSQAVGVAIMLWLREPALVVVGLVIYGFSLSGGGILQDLIWANYFGRLSLGAIRGVAMPFLMLFMSIGPLYFGYLYDVTGGYQIPLLGFIIALFIATALVLTVHPPKKREGGQGAGAGS